MEAQKPVHTLVLDTGAIIKNEPSVSTLLSQSECLIIVPAIIPEIKDAATRSRVDTTLRPFLTLRSPSPTSVKFVTDFARRTGDLAVLSKPDIQTIALAYEIECERNGGDWRLRRVPGQKRVNGPPPSKRETLETKPGVSHESETLGQDKLLPQSSPNVNQDMKIEDDLPALPNIPESSLSGASTTAVNQTMASLDISDPTIKDVSNILDESGEKNQQDPSGRNSTIKVDSVQNSAESENESNSDSEGWITPSNLKKKQLEDAASSTVQTPEPKTMQVAVLTTDYAMQNVILQMNLNLLSPSLTRVKHLKTFVLRCHACFQVTKDMSKRFCARCGQPSLTRVSCSTDANGEFKLHLKKNMQWNNRGDKYSIPKPVHGSANGRVKGGGKGSWGNDLILAEDQKEYQKAAKEERKTKERNLMDEDYLPSILTGDRGRSGGRIKIGAGKNVNARKR